MALTRRQKEVLDFIVRFIEENGYSPSYEEVARGLNLASLATVHKHIRALEAKHYLRCGRNRSRSLELAPKFFQEQRKLKEQTLAALEVPLAGRIAAGRPVEAVEARETIDLAGLVYDKDVFALEVRGDSMIEDHICDGDVVLVERTAQIQDGDIVVALVGGDETTLKRFYREPGGMARLQPANPEMAPIRVPLGEVQIQGRVLAVLRKYR
ncbi:MAG: transcriptional repressor LexA [Bryobacterales bacterium]|nr:transcriptional repressor LexA [Bryobacteraceae bacterium]MDW8353576.1 transcriptional repressor LexA [Bryobacterales bacterium]